MTLQQCFRTAGQSYGPPGGAWLPCGFPNATNPYVTCCVGGDTCYEDGLCGYTHSLVGGSGWYNGGCTDSSFQDRSCWSRCIDNMQGGIYRPDVIYDTRINLWACCGGDEAGNVDCANHINETFPAPPPKTILSYYHAGVGPVADQTSTSSTTAPASTSSVAPTPRPSPNNSLSAGAKAGIGISIALCALALSFLLYVLFSRWRQRQELRQEVSTVSELGTRRDGDDQWVKPELQASEPTKSFLWMQSGGLTTSAWNRPATGKSASTSNSSGPRELMGGSDRQPSEMDAWQTLRA